MNTYRVIARRAGDWWALEVPDLPGTFSQTKRLEQADESAREAIAVMLDVEPDQVAVEIEPDLTPAEVDALSELQQAQDAARAAAEVERKAMQRAAKVLTRDLSQRDAGRLLGLSFQRVSQILKSSTPSGEARGTVKRSKSRRGKISA